MSNLEENTSNVKVVKRPNFDKLVAQTMKPPHFENSENPEEEASYYLNYVSPTGKWEVIACTKGVYKDVEVEKLYKNYRVQFHLLFDTEKKLVSHINVKTKREFLPAGFTEENIVGHEKEVSALEISLSPDNVVKVLRAPTTTSTSTENEVLESIQKNADIKSGDYILGKYRVFEIRERDGFKTFHVDPEISGE
jgi:hypothetical protein